MISLFYHKFSMILTPHLLLGAVIGSKISNPFLALPVAVFSHYFLDSLPQKEYSIRNIHEKRWNKALPDFLKVFLDIFIGISLIVLFSDNNPAMLASAFLAIFPDGITLLGRIFSQNKLILLHQKFHQAVNNICDPPENKRIPAFLGIISQVIVVLTAIFFLR